MPPVADAGSASAAVRPSEGAAGVGTTRLALAGILLLATVLRAYGLGGWALEQDELYTLRDALFPTTNARPLYYVAVRLLLEGLPPTEVVLRGPAFVFGVLGVGTTWLLARRVFGTPAAHVAALLAALSPWHLYLSQYARYYSLVYLLSSLAVLLLLRAVDRDAPRSYLAALGALVLGCLSHPTFAFPMVGVVLAMYAVSPDGTFLRPRPTRNAWLYLWGPLGAAGTAALTLLGLTGSIAALRNGDGRSLRATLLQLAAMVEAATPVLVVAAAAGAAFLALLGLRRGDRRWGLATLLGCSGALALLVASAVWNDVYADYGTAMLPLVFVSVGGFVQRAAELMGSAGRAFVTVALLVLATSQLPGTVSHLSDGTRYDFRPAYRHIVATGREHLVVALPEVLQQHYAPGLRLEGLRLDRTFLTETLEETRGFWLIGRYNRFGLMSDGGRVEGWISAHCRTVLYTQRPRLDFRSFRVELHWCGAAEPPALLARGGA